MLKVLRINKNLNNEIKILNHELFKTKNEAQLKLLKQKKIILHAVYKCIKT